MAFHHRPETFATPAIVGACAGADAGLQDQIDAEFALIATLLAKPNGTVRDADRPELFDGRRHADMRAIVSAWRMRRLAKRHH